MFCKKSSVIVPISHAQNQVVSARREPNVTPSSLAAARPACVGALAPNSTSFAQVVPMCETTAPIRSSTATLHHTFPAAGGAGGPTSASSQDMPLRGVRHPVAPIDCSGKAAAVERIRIVDLPGELILHVNAYLKENDSSRFVTTGSHILYSVKSIAEFKKITISNGDDVETVLKTYPRNSLGHLLVRNFDYPADRFEALLTRLNQQSGTLELEYLSDIWIAILGSGKHQINGLHIQRGVELRRAQPDWIAKALNNGNKRVFISEFLQCNSAELKTLSNAPGRFAAFRCHNLHFHLENSALRKIAQKTTNGILDLSHSFLGEQRLAAISGVQGSFSELRLKYCMFRDSPQDARVPSSTTMCNIGLVSSGGILNISQNQDSAFLESILSPLAGAPGKFKEFHVDCWSMRHLPIPERKKLFDKTKKGGFFVNGTPIDARTKAQLGISRKFSGFSCDIQ